MKTLRYIILHIITYHFLAGTLKTSFLILSLFISAEMALEQNVKDIQAQNAQFQEMFTNLVQGQEDLKKLVTRKKKTIGILNMGRNHKGPARVVSRFEISDKSGEIEGSVKNSEGRHHGSENEDEDYVSEQYPSDNDKYK